MSRWIDFDFVKSKKRFDKGRMKFIIWMQDIYHAPSIDLVRCRECKKAHLTYDGECKYCDEWKDDDGNYIEVYHDGNHFCSYGERREDE